MKPLNIKIDDYNLSNIELIYKNFKNNKYLIFRDNIYYSLLNIKFNNQEYDLDTEMGQKLYFNRYFYDINTLLLSLNSYLLNIFIKTNPSENIYEKQDRKNTITFLFYKLLNENLLVNKSVILELIIRLYIYENFFRNQISHGWIKIFSNINSDEFKNLVVIKSIDNIILNESRDILDEMNIALTESMTIENFAILNIKKSRTKVTNSINNNNTNKVKEYSTLDYLRELLKQKNEGTIHLSKYSKSKKSFTYEPILSLWIDCKSIKQIDFVNETEYYYGIDEANKIKNNKNFYGECHNLIDFSLNNLIETILEIVNLLDN